jgi:battenin
VLYVVILSAAQDLVGSDVPKGVVLLADVLPSFATKLVAPYFIHRVPYPARVLAFAATSSAGMLLVATTPADRGLAAKMAGVVLASLSSGGGELSFLGLTHYYGPRSLAAWGSGTGAAGLVGAGLYVVLTSWAGLSVRSSLLASAVLPVFMILSFFVVLPKGPLSAGQAKTRGGYRAVARSGGDDDDDDNGLDPEDIDAVPTSSAATSLLAPGPSTTSAVLSSSSSSRHDVNTLSANLRRARALFLPYMLPLLLVYVAEYAINQGVAPTLLFPLAASPFDSFRDFYPFYGFLYQLGVFVSRTSIAWVRVRHLYLPALLQVANFALLTLQALYFFVPSVYLVFAVVFWEGLLGGAVYVNTFAEIMDNVPAAEREFSLGATTVSDSAGICIAGFIGMAIEPWLCAWQVSHGRDWCKRISAEG